MTFIGTGGGILSKKILSVVACAFLTLSTVSTVLANPLSDQLQNQKRQLQQNQSNLKNVQQKTENLEVQIEKLDNQIETLMSQIDSTKKQMNRTQSDIKSAQKDLEKSEKDIESQEDLFDKRMRAMYINGVDSYVEVIFESKGFSDFISRVETVKTLIDYDKKVIADMEAQKQVIAKKKQALDAENSKLMALKADTEQKLAKVNDTKTTQSKMLQDLKKQQRLYAAKVDQSKALVNSTMKQIEAISKAAPKYNASRGAAPLSSNAIVAYSANFLGRSYEWGGNGPSTFDCSGFVKYVYSHFGVSLPRVAADQQQVGTPVSRNQLQAGDLVFFGSPAHHVGIYVGNDCFIHAPKTGDVIKVSPLDRSDFSGGRRMR